jgi:hypothetical protein
MDRIAIVAELEKVMQRHKHEGLIHIEDWQAMIVEALELFCENFAMEMKFHPERAKDENTSM